MKNYQWDHRLDVGIIWIIWIKIVCCCVLESLHCVIFSRGASDVTLCAARCNCGQQMSLFWAAPHTNIRPLTVLSNAVFEMITSCAAGLFTLAWNVADEKKVNLQGKRSSEATPPLIQPVGSNTQFDPELERQSQRWDARQSLHSSCTCTLSQAVRSDGVRLHSFILSNSRPLQSWAL